MLDMDRQEKDEVKMKTKTCKNCYWWNHYDLVESEKHSDLYGNCENADNSVTTENTFTQKANNLTYNDESCTVIISTGENFGCIQFEGEN